MPLDRDRMPDVGDGLMAGVRRLGGGIRAAVIWVWAQLTGTLANWRMLVSDREFYGDRARGWWDFTILAPVRYYGKLLKWSLFGSPREQLWASGALAVSLIVASLGVLTYLAIIVFVPLALVALIRMVPAVNAGYTRLTGAGSRSSGRWMRAED